MRANKEKSGNLTYSGNSSRLLLVKPNVFEYLDFRAYCKDFLVFLRQKNAAFTFQTLVDKYGLQSRSHYLDILSGRKLTEKFMGPYTAILGFDKKEAEYFRALVGYAQATHRAEKSDYFATILKQSPNLETLKLEQEAYTYYSQWYYPVMLSVLNMYKHEKDHKKIAAAFKPKISAIEARQAIATLTDLGFISWNGDREEWHFHHKFLRSTDSAKAAALKYFHEEMQLLGMAAYKKASESQVFSSLTLSMSLRTKSEIEAMVTDLRKAILEKVKADPHPEVVVQANFQLFDVSKSIKGTLH